MAMGTLAKVGIGVVLVGGVGTGAFFLVRHFRRKSAQKALVAAASPIAPVLAARMAAGPAMALPMGKRVQAKKKAGSRFSRFGIRALRTGLRAGALAGVPGASQAQEAQRLLG